MLTKRENLLETIRGGHPDRYVNQYEPFKILSKNPYSAHNPNPEYGGEPVVNAWGVTRAWPKGTPGVFPVHDKPRLTSMDTMLRLSTVLSAHILTDVLDGRTRNHQTTMEMEIVDRETV